MIRMGEPGREPGKFERFARRIKQARVGGGAAAGVAGAVAFAAKFGPKGLGAIKNVTLKIKK